MRNGPDRNVRRLGIASGTAVAALGLSYVCVLLVGLLTLPSPDDEIQQPWLTLMEILIIPIAPTMVVLTVALHARSREERKSFALTSVVFMSMSAATTSIVHFTILTLSHQAAFASQHWSRLVFAFKWPSISYALDILAWDVFFPIAAFFAAAAVQGRGLARLVRVLLFASAALSAIGLFGVVLANMQVRNIGIIGYAVLFPVAAGALAKLMAADGPTGLRKS
jgi:hypothetical protein